MTESRLTQLNEFKKNIDKAIQIKNMFWSNYIEIKSPDKEPVSTVWLDKETRDEWTKINREFFDRRIKELEEEFERM